MSLIGKFLTAGAILCAAAAVTPGCAPSTHSQVFTPPGINGVTGNPPPKGPPEGYFPNGGNGNRPTSESPVSGPSEGYFPPGSTRSSTGAGHQAGPGAPP